ncbi:MAG: HEAT repeat domain-containing protein [Acidobacteriota bacterium]|nr:HEAT repeat domain-containing protein [Acidobacteriota bacterium]MDH3784831.1 HEAT repeat domain-containing protein [Acidobacteriota bacterium]
MGRRRGLPLLVAGFLLIPGLLAAQVDDPAQTLIREEQNRVRFAELLEQGTQHLEDPQAVLREFADAAHGLAAGGDGMLPFLFDEVDRTDQQTFFVCTYALGLMGGEEAKQILLQALERASGDLGDYGIARKAWTSYNLALLGETDSLEWVNARPKAAGHIPLFELTSTLEGMAIILENRATPILIKQHEALRPDPEYRLEWQFLIASLGRTNDERALPLLHKILQEDETLKGRQEAGRALANLARPASTPTLLAVLDNEPNEYIRRAAAEALVEIYPTDQRDALIDKFDKEGSPGVRMALLRMIVPMLGEESIPFLRKHWYRMRPVDRAEAVTSLTILGDNALPIVGRGLQSREGRVQTAAIQALGEIGTPQAQLVLESAVRSPVWTVAQKSAIEMAYRGFDSGAPAVAERVLDKELSEPIRDPTRRDRIYVMMNQLIKLNYGGRIDEFRAAMQAQPDSQLKAFIEQRLVEMRALADNGDDVKKWLKFSETAPEGRLRDLAYRRLSQLGGKPKSARVLVARFDGVNRPTQRLIVEALSAYPGEETTQLLTRVLTTDEFAGYKNEPLRDIAAYAARTLGGSAMRDLLGIAVDRTRGRDTRTLVYWSILAGDAAIPTLQRYRTDRVRYSTGRRGFEQIKLDRLARLIRAGRPLGEYDLPPDELRL